jgi:inositol oxygenase
VDINRQKRDQHLKLVKFRMGVWQALEYLNTIIDDSDPDNDMPQMQHALQSAEAARRQYPDAQYDWLHLTCLIHDLGKILAVQDTDRGLKADPQWLVVGDTFPVGCAFESSNVFAESFAANPDTSHPCYSTKFGRYQPHCGLDQVLMSWGHDEYLYQVCQRNHCLLPAPALAMIRYHSFYAWHTSHGYEHLTNAHDKQMLPWIQLFNQFDLYSKADAPCSVEILRPYYQSLIDKYFPPVLSW